MRHVKFSDVITRANTKEDRFNTDKLYYVGGEHIDSQELLVNNKGLIKGSTIGPMFYCGFKAGQVLFVTRNPHLRKCSAVTFDGICSEKTFVLETKDPTILLQSYLMVVMQSDEFWEYCEENKSGGVNYFINWSTLSEYEFDLPSIEDQESIAKKLWAAYEVKQSYVNMIAATDEMVKSQFIEMFGCKTPNAKVGDVSSVVSGKSISKDLEDIPGDIAYVKVADFNLPENNKYIQVSSRYVTSENANSSKLIPPGTIIFAKNGAASMSNKKRLTAIECCIDMNTLAIIPNSQKVDSGFLYAIFDSLDLSFYVRQGAVPSISPHAIEGIEIYLPSFDEQLSFSKICKQADKSKFELKKSIEAIDKVIKSLINNI